jgi:hypothetical protein
MAIRILTTLEKKLLCYFYNFGHMTAWRIKQYGKRHTINCIDSRTHKNNVIKKNSYTDQDYYIVRVRNPFTNEKLTTQEYLRPFKFNCFRHSAYTSYNMTFFRKHDPK